MQISELGPWRSPIRYPCAFSPTDEPPSPWCGFVPPPLSRGAAGSAGGGDGEPLKPMRIPRPPKCAPGPWGRMVSPPPRGIYSAPWSVLLRWICCEVNVAVVCVGSGVDGSEGSWNPDRRTIAVGGWPWPVVDSKGETSAEGDEVERMS